MFLGLKYFYMNVHSWNECQLHRLPKAKGLGYSAYRCLEIHGVLSTVLQTLCFCCWDGDEGNEWAGPSSPADPPAHPSSLHPCTVSVHALHVDRTFVLHKAGWFPSSLTPSYTLVGRVPNLGPLVLPPTHSLTSVTRSMHRASCFPYSVPRSPGS